MARQCATASVVLDHHGRVIIYALELLAADWRSPRIGAARAARRARRAGPAARCALRRAGELTGPATRPPLAGRLDRPESRAQTRIPDPPVALGPPDVDPRMHQIQHPAATLAARAAARSAPSTCSVAACVDPPSPARRASTSVGRSIRGPDDRSPQARTRRCSSPAHPEAGSTPRWRSLLGPAPPGWGRRKRRARTSLRSGGLSGCGPV